MQPCFQELLFSTVTSKLHQLFSVRLHYDDSGFLISMETSSDPGRLFVAVDHLGSPVAVFDSSGNLAKEISRSPFGRVVADSNPGLDLPVGFAGGIVDQYTGR